MNFIKTHLISKIKIMYSLNRNISDGQFLYLDEPISIGKGRSINRVNVWYLFCAGENVHTGWQEIPGTALCEAYSSMKTGKFYAYKCIQGKNYKLRRKCSEK
jgi:hypothetical protein